MSNVWDFIKDYQGVVGAIAGAILNAGISTTIALFIARRVAERGEITFTLNKIEADLFDTSNPKETVGVENFDRATEAGVTLYYHIYNNAGVGKALRAFWIGVKNGRKLKRITPEGEPLSIDIVTRDHSSTYFNISPRELLSIHVGFALKTMDDARNNKLFVVYRNEKGKDVPIEVGVLKDSPVLKIG